MTDPASDIAEFSLSPPMENTPHTHLQTLILSLGIHQNGGQRIKHLCLTIHFISLLKRRLSIKWKAICIFSTKDVCFLVGFQPLLSRAIPLKSCRHFKVSM